MSLILWKTPFQCIPSCETCFHQVIQSNKSYCSMFGYYNFKTKTIQYKPTTIVRQNNECGLFGQYYISKSNYWIIRENLKKYRNKKKFKK